MVKCRCSLVYALAEHDRAPTADFPKQPAVRAREKSLLPGINFIGIMRCYSALGYIVHEFVQAASTISDFIRLFNILVLFIFQGVGWSIPVLEKILSAVKKQLAIDNCCDQLRAILKLKRLLHLRNIEEDKESFPEVRSVFCTARRRRKKQKKWMHVCSF